MEACVTVTIAWRCSPVQHSEKAGAAAAVSSVRVWGFQQWSYATKTTQQSELEAIAPDGLQDEELHN